MIKSMTGFAAAEASVNSYGKVCVELRSSNHKFQEVILHLPPGFLSLEDRIKKTIESRIKRGRVTCSVNFIGKESPKVFVNKSLLSNYILAIKEIRKSYNIKSECSIDTLIQLPGVFSLVEKQLSVDKIWPGLNQAIEKAVNSLSLARQKEGTALCSYLQIRINALLQGIKVIKKRFKTVIKKKVSKLETSEEQASFLRDSDITEEIDRLSYHIKNFKSKLSKSVPVGKELDFIAQEMQREANTMASKSVDSEVSAKAVQLKSEIEKVREQVQNIE